MERGEIRRLLETDRAWACYFLADLAPGYFERTSWFGSGSAIAALYRGFTPPVLFALGSPADLAPALDEATSSQPRIYLHLRPEVLPLIGARYRLIELRPMWRMVLEGFRGAPVGGAVRLSGADHDALLELFDDGAETGERPEFFDRPMLDRGAYYGVWEYGRLIAAGGTHVLVAAESVAGLGNIYTRRDRRGRGLAAGVTSAIAGELLGLGIRTIALNVAQANEAAIRVYERLGFARHCAYYEGLAQALH